MPDLDATAGQDPVPPSWEKGTMVVLPSLSFPVSELVKITGIDHYEERLLCTVLLLDRPDLHIVYLTSQPVDPAVVEYHLGFLADPTGARTRLHLVSAGEAGPRPLTQKLLGRPEVLAQVRRLLPDDGSATLLPFNVTAGEWELATALGIPLDGSPLDRVALGSKTGSRRVARRAGVCVAEGDEALFSVEEVSAEIDRLRPRGVAGRAVVKPQRRVLRPGQRPGRPGRTVRSSDGTVNDVLCSRRVVGVVRPQDRRRGSHRGGASRLAAGVAERAAADRPGRSCAGGVDP